MSKNEQSKPAIMRIGGRAYKNGVAFCGNTYRVWFSVDKNGTHKIGYKKYTKVGQAINNLATKLRKIPIMGSIFSLLNTPALVVMLVGLVAYDIFAVNIGNAPVHYVVSVVLLLAMVIVLVGTFYKAKNIWRYHGAEHKVINAYYDNASLSVDEVKKCSRIAVNCGSNWAIFMVLLIPITVPVARYFTGYMSIGYIIVYILSLELFRIDNGHKKPLLKWCYSVGSFIQKYLVTQEPTDEQLAMSIDTFKKLLELEEK